MGFVDRLFGRPAKKSKRARMAYDGAARTRRTEGWRAIQADASGVWSKDGARLRDVSRDLIRNDAYAARAATTVVNAVVGSGIIPSADGTGSERVEAVLKAFCDTTAIDADGRHNLYGIQRLAMQTVFEAGEVIIRRRQRRAFDGLPLPFQLQILEPEYLDTSKDGQGTNGNLLVQGVEFDAMGRRVAYWLYDQHPASIYGRLPQSSRIDARSVVHLFRSDRPGQVRGLPWLAPVIRELQDLRDYKDAQLVRQKVAACFAAFIYDNGLENDVSDDDLESTELSETLMPGVMEHLPPGKDVKFTDPPDVGGFNDFVMGVLRGSAAGVGLTYEAMSGDLSNVNFSSARMGRLEMDRNVAVWQDLMFISQFCDRLAFWILEAVGEASLIIKWTAPRKTLVDPAREIPALVAEVAAGFRSRRDVIRSYGFDPETVMAEHKEDQKDSASLGVQFTTDPPTRATQSEEDAV